jgi:DHA1 family bicyclomycin/chloramphenicol resistance-like MFS transporter
MLFMSHSTSPASSAPRLSILILATLGAMAMLGPFGTDTYLPALPSMAADFGTSGARIQLTIAAFTIGEAVGQFSLGSLSDRWGRKVIIVTSTGLLALTSGLGALAPSAEVLIALCLVMGFLAAGGVVVGRAVVADLVEGEAAARPFAVLSMLLSIGPIVGPIVGTMLLGLGWRSIFVGLCVFALVCTVAAIAFVPESLPRELRHSGGLGHAVRTSGKILATREFTLNAAILWFGFGLMFTYICSSSFIIQTTLGLSPAVNAATFALIGVGLVLISIVTARFSVGRNIRRLQLAGIAMQVAGVALLAVIVVTHTYEPWLVIADLALIGMNMGFVFGPSIALAMEHVRFASGTASALLGSFQFLAAAVVSAAVGLVPGDALVGLLVVGGCSEILVLVTLALSRWSRPRVGAHETV